ncbi:rhomboid family intramembrane serine protease [Nocardioides sp. R-C-SC26]|uniref:rhomboid family intramembrane serine protease n=1 Tax=Nocardioides sp. R-C-SC26 TaxID=2870414 RepID=UPI001E4B3AE6|nr:rhomboid family intramembrane serine protease [Nocardioides sp. R-C-SC26]
MTRRAGGPHATRPTWQTAGATVVGFVVVLWAIEVVDTVASHRLDQYGVRPRTDEGLLGIVVAPLLHSGWTHLEANSVPALVLGFLVLVTGLRRGLIATAVIWVFCGVGVWLLGPAHTNHIGASGLVFGWLVLVMIRGFLARHVGEIALGVAVFVVYGSLLWGVLPGEPGISWQGHLFGALGGVVAAVVTRPRARH